MITQTKPYAKSTIAMSSYNAIALSGGKADTAIIFDVIMRAQHPLLEIEVLEKSLKKLLRKKYVRYEVGNYSLYDSQRRMVVARDLSDVVVDTKGIPRGGWNRWMIRDFADGLRPIEEILHDFQ